MSVGSARIVCTTLLLGLSSAGVAFGQTPASSAAPAATDAPPVEVAQPAAPTAASSPPQAVVPPGYMLVPIPNSAAETRYDVQYPQARGALPPGMELPYDEGEPIPSGYRLRTAPRRGLVIAGSIVTGVPWVFSVTAAVGNDFKDRSGFLLVPALGPWLMLATGGANDDPCSDTAYSYCEGNNSGTRAILVLDGLAQTAGAVMFITGFAFPRKRLMRGDVTVSFAPSPVGRDGYGLGAVGTF